MAGLNHLTLGNHEFDHETNHPGTLRPLLKKYKLTPVVCNMAHPEAGTVGVELVRPKRTDHRSYRRCSRTDARRKRKGQYPKGTQEEMDNGRPNKGNYRHHQEHSRQIPFS